MAPQISNMNNTLGEQDDTWIMVEEGVHLGKRKPQLEECDISPTQAGIFDEALPDLACKPTHTICSPPTVDGVLHNVNASSPNPTPDPRMESVESTATGRTFSAPEDVSSDPQPRPPAEDNSQLRPLTTANLRPDTANRLIRDIQAWINGELSWLRVVVEGDQASVMPFEGPTTRQSSDGSLDFIFIPAQPSNFERDALAIGTMFEHLPYTQTYSPDMKLDEVWDV